MTQRKGWQKDNPLCLSDVRYTNIMLTNDVADYGHLKDKQYFLPAHFYYNMPELKFQAIKHKYIEDGDGEATLILKVNMQDKLQAFAIKTKVLLDIIVKENE